ncbi:MAG: DUF1552 domain-containing protein [Phycisphaerales bacterium]
MSKTISRRTVLRGIGVSMALPWLDAMGVPVRRAAAAATRLGDPTLSPVRLAFIFTPNGVNYDAWAPRADGDTFTLSPSLEPLASVRQHLNIHTGLTLQKARANGDGPGDHARSSASFLTGQQARKTAGNDIRNGTSVDQIAASHIGRRTRLPSIELGCEHGPSSGNCDSGYSCAYSSNISWRDESTPMPKIVDPGDAFDQLFGDAAAAAASSDRLSRRQSILDFVLDDTKKLTGRLGPGDRRKIDQFQSSVREIEQRIQHARDEAEPPRLPDAPRPAGVPEKVSEHFDLMFDMLLLAFQTDTTRIGTLMLANDGSNRTFPEIGVKDGHHHLSHHQNNQEMIDKIRLIDRFHMERFARFIRRLAETPEADGSLLDHSLILSGSGISDGNRHNHENLPILVAGRGGGDVVTGRLLRHPPETPLCNLYLAMLERCGCRPEAFGDSTGLLTL